MNIVWISKIEGNTLHKTSRLKMSDALIKKGNNVKLYMVRRFGEEVIKSDNIFYTPTIHYPILSGIFYGLVVFFYFPVIFSKKRVDFIIIDSTKISLIFTLSLKILNVPMILDIRTLPVDIEKSFFFKFNMFLSRYVINGITTITPELKSVIKNNYNLKDKKIGVWSSGVSIEDFNMHEDKKYLNNKSKQDKFILFYHGDYSPTRGIENLILAINKLDPQIKDKIKLEIVGMSKETIKYLSKFSEKEGLNEQVVLLPKVDYNKIIQYLAKTDVGIVALPPDHTWWKVSAPLKTLEYMAAAKPIIVTNIPFHEKIFEKGECGILIKDNKPHSIADAINCLFKDQNKLTKMGSISRRIVERHYTWDIMAQKFEDFLKSI